MTDTSVPTVSPASRQAAIAPNAIAVAGVAKVTEAGLEVRFQTLDPALAPQPMQLKAGGGVRVLLVKFSRSFEATRTDFKRVVPFDEAAAPGK